MSEKNEKQTKDVTSLATTEVPQAQKPLSKEERIERSWDFLNDITNKVDALHSKVLKEIMAAGRILTYSEVSYVHDDNPPHLRSIGKNTSVNKDHSSH